MTPSDADYEAALFAAELGDVPEIDLHGMDTHLAIRIAEDALHHAHYHSEPAIRIIHGKGNGAVRLAIHHWLRTQTTVVGRFRDSTQPWEYGGVTVVALKRLTK